MLHPSSTLIWRNEEDGSGGNNTISLSSLLSLPQHIRSFGFGLVVGLSSAESSSISWKSNLSHWSLRLSHADLSNSWILSTCLWAQPSCSSLLFQSMYRIGLPLPCTNPTQIFGTPSFRGGILPVAGSWDESKLWESLPSFLFQCLFWRNKRHVMKNGYRKV